MSNIYPITRKIINKKFKYFYKNNKVVTDKKEIERINKLRMPPGYNNIKIFSSNSKEQYTAYDNKGRIQKGYHELWIKERNRKKFRDLIEFTKVYSKLMRYINNIISKIDNISSKYEMIALAVGLLDSCRIRPGSNKHLKNTGSYGTTTLCKKHITKKNINGKTYYMLNFNGKSGVINECKLKSNTNLSKKLYDLYKKTKTKNSSIFMFEDHKITATDINNFLQKVTSKDITVKIFRTYHANIDFIQKILHNNEKLTENQRKKYCISVIKEVAIELHHNPSTFRNSYLFTPLKDLYINNPIKFKNKFKNNIDNSLIKFIKKNTDSKASLPKKW